MREVRPAGADKACDVVMEGGAASGIVYPRAIYELSKRYRFQRVGGTSAGAVAAAAAAAAEYGRRKAEQQPGKGNPSSFAVLEEIPDWFAEEVDGAPRLKYLFEPEPKMRPAYELFMAVISNQGLWWIWRLLFSAARFFPVSLLVGASLGGLIAALAVYGATQIDGWVSWLLGIGAVAVGTLATVVFAGLLVLVSLGYDVVVKLPRNYFGVARGYSKPSEEAPSPRVTNWMHDLIQKLAGQGDPLTFGDLEGCPDTVIGNDKGIVLRLMTTCLTHGRPYRMPFADDEIFYYRAEELELFFPAKVVEWMNQRPNPIAEALPGYHALPRAREFPVVVAARMSLAFPFFFSSVPLYALDRTRRPDMRNRDEALEGRGLDRVWFADGGICSNLPVHFFDRALPRWPTFALDLRAFHRDLTKHEDEERNVWIDHEFLDDAGHSIITEWWTELKHEPKRVDTKLGPIDSYHRAKNFLGTVFNTMMDWHDNAQLRPVGSRDRVAHVSLDDTEGSFNLCMDSRQISALAERGRHGGSKLRDRFAEDDGWSDNRRARLYSFLTVTGEYLQWVRLACEQPVSGDTSYEDELNDPSFCPPVTCRRLTPEQLGVARGILERALAAARWLPNDSEPRSLVAIVPPPRQTIRFFPEAEPIAPRDPEPPYEHLAVGPEDHATIQRAS
jgi:predicted acylesterase/phospholipase RssA